MSTFSESVVEDAALAWLSDLGYTVLHGPDIALDGKAAERTDPLFRDTVLQGRLRDALTRLNPSLPPDAIDDAARKLLRADAPTLIERNRAVHRVMAQGVEVEFRRLDGSIGGAPATPRCSNADSSSSRGSCASTAARSTCWRSIRRGVVCSSRSSANDCVARSSPKPATTRRACTCSTPARHHSHRLGLELRATLAALPPAPSCSIPGATSAPKFGRVRSLRNRVTSSIYPLRCAKQWRMRSVIVIARETCQATLSRQLAIARFRHDPPHSRFCSLDVG